MVNISPLQMCNKAVTFAIQSCGLFAAYFTPDSPCKQVNRSLAVDFLKVVLFSLLVSLTSSHSALTDLELMTCGQVYPSCYSV